YINNGFSNVSISPLTTENEIPTTGKQVPLKVVYNIDEGPQQRVAVVRIEGAQQISVPALIPLLNTAESQPLSPQNLAGDRDALITYYLDKGFDQVNVDVVDTPVKPAVQVDVAQNADHSNAPPSDSSTTEKLAAAQKNTHEILFRVQEGRQLFVRNILVTGLHYTRAGTIAKAITFHDGDPLSKTEMATTQRNLYDFALFSEVNIAVVNPVSTTPLHEEQNSSNASNPSNQFIPTLELPRTVLIQTTEASR